MNSASSSPSASPNAGAAAVPLAVELARVADDNKCEDVQILDLRGLSSVADYFVLCTGTSDRQMRAVVDHMQDHAKSLGQRPYRLANAGGASWVVADFVDVVVHVFDREHRQYYDIDGLWGDAPRVEWRRESRT